MVILGVIVALCLIHNISTAPLDPLLLHFFTHGSNIQVICPALLAEWHPDRKQNIQHWINLGPNGDPASFQKYIASYHNVQVNYYNVCYFILTLCTL